MTDIELTAYKVGVADERARCARICDDFNMATNDVKERHLILDIKQRILSPDMEKGEANWGDTIDELGVIGVGLGKLTQTPPEGYELVTDREEKALGDWLILRNTGWSQVWDYLIKDYHELDVFARPINQRKESDDMHIPVDTRGNQPSPEIQKESKGVIDYTGLYNELLFAVGNAFPNESRHETALRYIREAELSSGEAYGENTDLTEMQARIAQEGGSPI